MHNDDDLLRKTYALARENNKLLRRMRRAAIWGTIIKLVIYGALLGVPVWLYFQFFQPVLQEAYGTVQQFQETGENAQGQFSELQELIGSLPGLGSE